MRQLCLYTSPFKMPHLYMSIAVKNMFVINFVRLQILNFNPYLPLLSCKLWILLTETLAAWANIFTSVLLIPSWKLWRNIDCLVLQWNKNIAFSIFWLPLSCVWIARFHTSNPLNLVKPASSCIIDRRISFKLAAEITQHCSMDLLSANHWHCESMCCVLQCRLIAVLAVLSTAESLSRMCLKYSPKDMRICSENFCKLMNTPQKMSSLPTKVITPEN
jgi:hypothetical protein